MTAPAKQRHLRCRMQQHQQQQQQQQQQQHQQQHQQQQQQQQQQDPQQGAIVHQGMAHAGWSARVTSACCCPLHGAEVIVVQALQVHH
jgi:hypothetical protein